MGVCVGGCKAFANCVDVYAFSWANRSWTRNQLTQIAPVSAACAPLRWHTIVTFAPGVRIRAKWPVVQAVDRRRLNSFAVCSRRRETGRAHFSNACGEPLWSGSFLASSLAHPRVQMG